MAEQAFPLYVNGRFVHTGEASLSPLDRGFTLADGVFDTMVALGDRIFRLDDHLSRLQEGAALLELPLPPQEELVWALQETWRRSGLSDAVLRLAVARGPDPDRGLRPKEAVAPTVVVRAFYLSRERDVADRGVSLHTCSFPRNERSPLTRAKFLAYTEPLLAWLEARRAGADDALWRNTRGSVVCATTSNLFVAQQRRLVTPPTEEGALPGIARRAVMELASGLGLEVTKEPIPPAALADAAEVFLTNVVRGPLAVVAVDGRRIGSGQPGPVTRELAEAYWREVEVSTGKHSP